MSHKPPCGQLITPLSLKKAQNNEIMEIIAQASGSNRTDAQTVAINQSMKLSQAVAFRFTDHKPCFLTSHLLAGSNISEVNASGQPIVNIKKKSEAKFIKRLMLKSDLIMPTEDQRDNGFENFAPTPSQVEDLYNLTPSQIYGKKQVVSVSVKIVVVLPDRKGVIEPLTGTSMHASYKLTAKSFETAVGKNYDLIDYAAAYDEELAAAGHHMHSKTDLRKRVPLVSVERAMFLLGVF